MIAVASLIVLIAVIAFSAVTKKNAGVVGLVAAYIFSIVAAKCGTEINVSKVVTGNWPTSVFFIVLATTFLFGIATLNGTTQALSKNIVCLARGNAKILPVIFFLFGAIISAAGAGGLIVAVIMPLALFVAVENGISVLMMSLVTMGGITVGGICVGCAPESVDRDKLYNQLLLAAVSFIVMSVVLSFIGVFRIFG